MKNKMRYMAVTFAIVLWSATAIAEQIFIRSNNAKLYKALELIDDRDNWLKVSELLREVLASDISDPFIRKSLNLAKWEIDAELVKNAFRTRILDWPFVVAKLRIIEAMMANHPLLNVSYDREVPLIKGLLQSYFFPGHEEEGEVIFPDPATYKFDIYGYVKENILKTETVPGGETEDPRFPQQPNPMRDDYYNRLRLRRTLPDSRFFDRPELSHVESPQDFDEEINLIREALERSTGLFGSTFEQIADFVKVVRKVHQYEPWALLLTAIVNPDAVEYDPQLRDFIKGVKLKIKVGTYDYQPEQQRILKESLLHEGMDVDLELEEDIDETAGTVTLYALSRLTSPEMVSMRFLTYFKKYMDFYRSEKGRHVASLIVAFSNWLDRIARVEIPADASRWTTFWRGTGKVAGKVGSMLIGAEGVIAKLITWERFQKFLKKVKSNPLVKNERYFKIAIALTMATDMAEGVVRILGARDRYDVWETTKTTVSREAATLLYVLPLVSQRAVWRYLGWGAVTLDIGHWVTPNIPRTADVIHAVVFDYGVAYLMDWVSGKTVTDVMIEDYETQLAIVPQEHKKSLASFQRLVDISRNSAELAAYD